MIDEPCHHQVSNNRLEGKRNMEGIQAIGLFVQGSYTLDAHGTYRCGHPSVALRGEKTTFNEVMQ